MLLPAISHAELPEKAATAAGGGLAPLKKININNEIENIFKDLLEQLETLPNLEPGEFPVPESGRLLPLADLEGKTIPPGLLQSRVMQALDNPGELMQTLARLRQELRGHPGMLPDQALGSVKIQDLSSSLMATESNEQAAETMRNQMRSNNLQDGRQWSLFVRNDVIRGNDLNLEQASGTDPERPAKILAIDDPGQLLIKPSSMTAKMASRETVAVINMMPSLSPVHTLVRTDAPVPVITSPAQVFTPGWSESFQSNILVLVRDQVQT
ncbi:MAG: hypothetical protein R3318_05550, partial [Gammaproteobacteria bacterium]|nr:hypothetical protein [Gammaproteobacteria bacterium]